MTDLSKNIQALREKKAVVEMGGGEAAIEKQVAMGKLTARERILSLLDKNSFHEYDLFVKHDGRDFGMDKKDFPGDGVVTGTGTIFGAPVCIYARLHGSRWFIRICNMPVRSRILWIQPGK